MQRGRRMGRNRWPQHPGGMTEGSRGLSVSDYPRCMYEATAPRQGCQNGAAIRGSSLRSSTPGYLLASLRLARVGGARHQLLRERGCVGKEVLPLEPHTAIYQGRATMASVRNFKRA